MATTTTNGANGERTTTTVAGAKAGNNNTQAPPDAALAILDAKDDAYGGVIVDEAGLPADPREFSARLASSIAAWKARGVRGVWLRLPPALSALVAPTVSDHGFGYHHAEPAYVMLTRWLPLDDGVESGLPPNASHQVGVGALVVDARRGLVLAVQERSGPLRGKGVWKLPTGLVHAGEDLHAAAVREVEEETGVKERFGGVLAVRQAHGFAFGKSDLFFLCALVAEDDGGGGGGGGGNGNSRANGDGGAHTAATGPDAKQEAPEGNGAPPSSSSPPPLPSRALGPPQAVVACEREIERVAWLSVDDYEREQSKFNGHLPLYSEMLGRSMGWARAAVSAAAAATAETAAAANGAGRGGGGSVAASAAAAVDAAVGTARCMGMRGEVLDAGIFKPRSDLLMWRDDGGGRPLLAPGDGGKAEEEGK